MASPEELTPLLPETLPDDFGEWDGEASPEPSPIKPGEWEAWEAAHSFGESKGTRGQLDDQRSTAASTVETPRALASAPSAPVPVTQQTHFIEWDGEPAPAPTPKPVDLSEWEAWEAAHSFGNPPKPQRQSSDLEASLSPVREAGSPLREASSSLLDKPRVSGSAPSASVLVEQPVWTPEPANGSNGRASQARETSHAANEIPVAPDLPKAAAVNGKHKSAEVATSLKREQESALFQSFSPKDVEVSEDPKAAKKKWMIIAPIGAGSVLLALTLMISLLHHGAKPAAKQSVQPPAETTDTQPGTDTTIPSSEEPSTQNTPVTTTQKQQTPDNQATNQQPAVKPSPAPSKKQAKMMDDQLTAPTQIPQGSEKQDAPPPVSFGAAGADGLGGTSANESVLNEQAQPAPKVVPSRPFAISSGVATGMLIRQTQPVYPSIAKAARVSGTVVLHASIAANGAIKDLQVVSGPAMLRQAAADAVRTWRYKPYKLSNEPVEVQTTISVVFTPER
jgi:periplasmic protein TonB